MNATITSCLLLVKVLFLGTTKPNIHLGKKKKKNLEHPKVIVVYFERIIKWKLWSRVSSSPNINWYTLS